MKVYDAVGIGNAIVDVIAPAEESFLAEAGIEKGIMQLVERDRAEWLYDRMKNAARSPGGSVANTLAGLGALGLETGFAGRVADDDLGRFYADETAATGTDFVNPPVAGADLPTSRSMIFVSPDGERSMNTYLGTSADLGPDDVSDSVMGATRLLFLEGYLYDKPAGKAAFDAAARLCRASGGLAGIALSDPFCVERHRADFLRLVGELDYVIGNQDEWRALFETEDLDTALSRAAETCQLIVCTRSGEDVIIIRGDERVTVPVTRVTPVDATGAGDLFAAGFLFGLLTGQNLETCGRMGTLAAAEIISHVGARPLADLRRLFADAGLPLEHRVGRSAAQ